MSTSSALVIVVVVAVLTYALRAVVIIALADRRIPLLVERALRQVGPAVIAALALNLAAGGDGEGGGLGLAETLALLAAGLVAWRTRNLLVSLLAGMAALWLTLALT